MTERNHLNARRPNETFDLSHGGHNTKFQVTLGFYDNGKIGEVFVSGTKTGSDVDALARDGAVLISLAIQHGVPIEVLSRAITREAGGKASTIIGAVIDIITKNANEEVAS